MCLVQDRQKLILLLQKAYFGQLSEEEAGLLAEWRSRSSEHEALYRRIIAEKAWPNCLSGKIISIRNKRIGRFCIGLKNVDLFG